MWDTGACTTVYEYITLKSKNLHIFFTVTFVQYINKLTIYIFEFVFGKLLLNMERYIQMLLPTCFSTYVILSYKS